MDENKISSVKALLYDTDNDEVKRTIFQTEDQEILYVYAYNYNWDNGFDIPQAVLDNEKCDLSIALLIFYRADGLSYLEDKSDNANLPQWSSFIKRLYDSILTGKYQRKKIFSLKILKENAWILIYSIKSCNKFVIFPLTPPKHPCYNGTHQRV